MAFKRTALVASALASFPSRVGPAGLAIMVLAAALAPTAHAREMDGRFGIGIEQSLGGASGLAIRYFTGESLAIQATLGVDMTIVSGDISAGVAASAGLAFQLARSEHAHLSVGARLTVGYRSLDAFQIIDPTATESDVHVAIELPIGLEVWLADNFSVGAATGILINIVPEGGSQLDSTGVGSDAPPGSVGIGIGAGSVTGTLFILYYF